MTRHEAKQTVHGVGRQGLDMQNWCSWLLVLSPMLLPPLPPLLPLLPVASTLYSRGGDVEEGHMEPGPHCLTLGSTVTPAKPTNGVAATPSVCAVSSPKHTTPHVLWQSHQAVRMTKSNRDDTTPCSLLPFIATCTAVWRL